MSGHPFGLLEQSEEGKAVKVTGKKQDANT